MGHGSKPHRGLAVPHDDEMMNEIAPPRKRRSAAVRSVAGGRIRSMGRNARDRIERRKQQQARRFAPATALTALCS
jgi:hypothetical protein